MTNINSVLSFAQANAQELQDALGITQFLSEFNWYQTIAGILLQGGKTDVIGANVASTITFNVSFNKQCLGVFVQALDGSAAANNNTGSIGTPTLDNFVLANGGGAKAFFWLALGI